MESGRSATEKSPGRPDRLLDTLNVAYMRFVYVHCLTIHGKSLGPYNSALSTKFEPRNYFVGKLATPLFAP
jgi:hypothetical protein